ncbi:MULTISPECIES: UvrD-helicase domain-containing protein [unclassified Acinetobacter]|uniref:UvrD-helicase domain-containing protein n=1 Tax=unclassified Acinetobacter TaxID=196816 RepID=UPI000447DF79|nr:MULTISPECIES: UvrD-helicase domain-containing protein [unclassified Acinetobacter]EZQ12371.1 exonuclease V subunit beta [Acinetobacter sp. Ver3]
MSQKPIVSYQPIVDMHFTGLHWIEASAGTGKTYTLSSLMVRILLEEYLPKQIIATTFTRKAAAELKSRIRARLIEVLGLLESCRELTQDQVQARAKLESDILYQVILNQFSGLIAHACARLKLVIDQLEELFVGTLDSFSQKLLREFAFESGKIERMQITNDAKQYTVQLIHDELRAWIQQQPQSTVDYLLLKKKIKSQDAYIDLIETSLNFSSAYFKAVPAPTIDVDAFRTHAERFIQIELETLDSLTDFYDPEGQYYAVVAKKWRDQDKLKITLTQLLPEFLDQVKSQGIEVIFASHLSTHLSQLNELRKKVLNKCPVDVLAAFEQHPIIVELAEFFKQFDKLNQQLEHLESYLQYYLAQQVKQRLPELLQQKSETTFSQQIRTLAEALQGAQGQEFAKYVHARYPLILVDEFQDTNQDQDDMLAQIWRHPSRVKQGCMIMVGDRKQAIYGFRGGDMLTFLKAYQDVGTKAGRFYQLVHNHRSVKPLVEVVDALFQQQMDFGEQVEYTPVTAGTRPHPVLIQSGLENYAPLRWVQVNDKEHELEQVAWKIRDLLNQAAQSQLYFEKQGQRIELQADDIAVLSRNNPDLDKVHHHLLMLGIPVNRPSRKSVFKSGIARDVGAILTAIMNPFDEAKLKRALLTRLMGFNLHRFLQLQIQADGLSLFITKFEEIREMWMGQGFLTAWQSFLTEFKVWTNLVEQFSYDNEREVVNLRHISELLSQNSDELRGMHTLYHWYMRQLSNPMEREWEIERQLSNQAGVHLLTIHQSKGLEFKIVFLLGADRKLSDRSELNFSIREVQDHGTGKSVAQRVVALKREELLEPLEVEQHDQRALAEHRRLWYVALTRAQHRVYSMMSDQKGQSIYGLAFWRGHGANQFQHAFSLDEPCLEQCPEKVIAKKEHHNVQMIAQKYPQVHFYPRAKTSFSYLAQHLSHQQIKDRMAAQDMIEHHASDEVNAVTLVTPYQFEDLDHQQPLSWIRAHFPMGTLAGNFLHEIFEHIDFQDRRDWTLEIRRRFKNAYSSLWEQLFAKFQSDFHQHHDAEQHLLEMMAEWLAEVLETPIQPEFRLKQLVPEAHLAEFPFYLALADRIFGIQRIQQLFLEFGLNMPEFNAANSARYLNGSIDLVYYDGERYHIADYKSNYLGNHVEDYSAQAIQLSMTHASYWLQAALYLVALHRYLSIHIDDYNIDRDLGGASYLYLRGMNGTDQYGFNYWRPSSEFILRLDAILGYFAEDKNSKIA